MLAIVNKFRLAEVLAEEGKPILLDLQRQIEDVASSEKTFRFERTNSLPVSNYSTIELHHGTVYT